MMLLITFIQGDEYLIHCDCFADLDSLYNVIGVDPDDIVSIRRFYPKEVRRK